MKNFKKISILLTIMIGLFVFIGCSKEEVVQVPTVKMSYEANKEVDKVKYSISDHEGSLTPMHDDTKVKSGYISTVNLSDRVEDKLTIEIIDEGNVVLKKENIQLDFSEKKLIVVSIIDNDNGELDIKIGNK